MEAIPWSAPLFRQFERGEKIVVVGRSELVSENFLAKHYISVMIALPRLITAASLKWMKWMAAARWSGLRLLLYPTCVDTVPCRQQIQRRVLRRAQVIQD